MGALNVIKLNPWGTLQLSPPSDNQEVAVGFYRYADKRVSNPGDAWLIGQQLWGNTGSLVIGTGNIAGCLTINSSGNVNIPYSLSINNVDILSKFNNYQPVGNYLTTSSTITSSKDLRFIQRAGPVLIGINSCSDIFNHRSKHVKFIHSIGSLSISLYSCIKLYKCIYCCFAISTHRELLNIEFCNTQFKNYGLINDYINMH
jgi:hypothetical protein